MNKLGYAVLEFVVCIMLAVSPVAGEKITIKDDLGRDVSINSPSQRIVFAMENALKTYYAVGDPKNIVALKDDKWMRKLMEDIFVKVDPQFEQKLTVKLSGDLLNLEDLAKAEPDLVVLWATSPEDPNLKAINETLKVPTYAIFVRSLPDIFKQVEAMGKISGNERRAAEVKGIMEKYVAKVTNVTSKIPETDRPKVYWMWSDILGTAGVESGINDVIDQAGGANVLQSWDNSTKSMEHPMLTLEALIKLNPDVIYMWYNENLDPKDIMTGAEYKGWKDINADRKSVV
jgi:iron complex transport system substrate-binding protein